MPKRQQYESDNASAEDLRHGKKPKNLSNESKEQVDPVGTQMHKDDEGNEYWEVSSFKGTLMVGIREFYEKDGKMLPGKKGISLTTDQFASVLQILPQVEAALHSRGVSLPRPEYNTPVTTPEQKGVELEQESDEPDRKLIKSTADPIKPKTKKANHEATDDEDE
nr:putative rna polymerase ii transcriptional coactivator [Quercus suber]